MAGFCAGIAVVLSLEIVGALIGVRAVGLAAGDDRFQKQMLSRFHVGHQVDIALESNDQDALAWIALLIGVLEHIQELTSFDGHHHRLKAELPFGDELGILLRAPREGLHGTSLAKLCA